MNTYRPILRWKRGEQVALENLDDKQKSSTYPLINLEAHPYNPAVDNSVDEAFEKRIQQDAQRLVSSYDSYCVAVDLGDIEPNARCGANSTHPVLQFFKHLAENKNSLVANPVVRSSNDEDFIKAVKEVLKGGKSNLVIRIVLSDIVDPNIEKIIEGILNRCNTSIEESEVVLDMGFLEDETNASLRYSSALNNLPHIGEWKEVAIVGGSFPRDLASLSLGRNHVPRQEWLVWKKSKTGIVFGDYATIHPVAPEEEIDWRTTNPSASIRYTNENEWLVLRGQGYKTPQAGGFRQFHEHSKNLISMPEFQGESFSFGDREILRISSNPKHPGNLTTWVTICVNHHIAYIVNQLSSQS